MGVFCLVFVMYLCAFVVYNGEFVTFPLVFWARCGTGFYFTLSSEINAYQNQIKVISITSEMI